MNFFFCQNRLDCYIIFLLSCYSRVSLNLASCSLIIFIYHKPRGIISFVAHYPIHMCRFLVWFLFSHWNLLCFQSVLFYLCFVFDPCIIKNKWEVGLDIYTLKLFIPPFFHYVSEIEQKLYVPKLQLQHFDREKQGQHRKQRNCVQRRVEGNGKVMARDGINDLSCTSDILLLQLRR